MPDPNSRPKPLPVKINALWNAFGCLFYLGCQWVITVLVVVLSSNYSNSGILAYAMSIGNMFASISLFKVRTYQVSDINDEYSARNYVCFRLLTIATSFIVIGIYTTVITNSWTMAVATIAYLLFKTDETFVDVLYGIEQKNGRMDFIGKSQLIRGVCSLIGFIVPILITQDVVFSILGMTLLCVATTLIYDRKRARLFNDIRARISRNEVKGLVRACLLPTIANLCATSIVSVARQMYGNAAGEELLGIYASIATPAVLIQAGASYLYSPLIGSMAAALFNDGLSAFIRIYIKVLGLMIGAMTIVVVGFTVIGNPLLRMVYGQSIEGYIWLLPYALLATASIALLLYINDVLIVLRDNFAQLIINLIALALVVLTSGTLISTLEMNGINFAIILACVPSIVIGTIVIIKKSRQQ